MPLSHKAFGGVGMRTPHLSTGACPSDPADRVRRADSAVWHELTDLLAAIPGQCRSRDEDAMVVADEVNEIWEYLRRNQIRHGRAEAAPVAAMAIGFVADLYEAPGSALERLRVAAGAIAAARESVGLRGWVLAASHEVFGFAKRELDALWAAVRYGDPAWDAGLRVAAAVRCITEIHSTPAVVRGSK